VTERVSARLSVNEAGEMLTGPIPAGRTPRFCGPPSIVRLTVELKAFGFLFEVVNAIVPVAVPPVLGVASTMPLLGLEKSRSTPPTLTATG
jgi:hypothetical protein